MGRPFAEKHDGGGFEQPVDFVESIPDLSRSDRELILGGNAKRLLRLA